MFIVLLRKLSKMQVYCVFKDNLLYYALFVFNKYNFFFKENVTVWSLHKVGCFIYTYALITYTDFLKNMNWILKQEGNLHVQLRIFLT